MIRVVRYPDLCSELFINRKPGVFINIVTPIDGYPLLRNPLRVKQLRNDDWIDRGTTKGLKLKCLGSKRGPKLSQYLLSRERVEVDGAYACLLVPEDIQEAIREAEAILFDLRQEAFAEDLERYNLTH